MSRIPSVSVIIPCFEQGRYLHEAIESALAQDGVELEVIVVDDGSTDSSPEVARRYAGVRYVRQANQGTSAARNAGFRLSSGEFVIFLDADDRLRAAAVASSHRLLRERPECAFVYGRHKVIDSEGRPLPSTPQPSDAANAYRLALRGETHPIHTPGEVVYRREVLESVGGFASRFDGCEDLHLNLRITQTAPVCFNERVVLDHRMHGESMKKRSAHMLRTSIAVQRTQRDFVRANRQFADDYRVGMRIARKYFGRHVAEDIPSKVARGELSAAARDLGVLLRYDPSGTPRHLWRAIRRGAARTRA
jgi:glycosyltransferase involved in cell wall biosynthesis